eukprot:jgi/Tetstr1/433574/TSEL_022841.t1
MQAGESIEAGERYAAVAAARPRLGPLGDFLAGEAARAPVVPAAPVADSGLDDRLTAWAYVGAGGASVAGGLGLGWVASGALPAQTSRGAPPDTSDPPQPGHNGDVAWEGVEGSYAIWAAGQARDQVILSAQRPYRSTARRRPLGGLMQSWISKIWNSPSTALPGEQESNPAGGESNHLQLNRN